MTEQTEESKVDRVADKEAWTPDLISESLHDEAEDVVDGADEGESRLEGSDDAVVIEKNDRSLSELNRWFKSKRLIIDPEWQRHYVWNKRRASKLIESFLMDIPVPVIYLAKTDDGKYEVIDGVQRLTSVFDFLDGKFVLSGLDCLAQFNKKKYGDLPTESQSKIEDSTLRTFELSARTSKNLLFVIFERLNTGGVALNEMEIRNCIYRGKLNNLIKELAKYPPFLECVHQKNLDRRMTDRSLVLRFLAFYEKGYQKAQSGLKAFLNDFLENYRNPSDKKIKEFRDKFKSAMKASKTVFGEQAFRVRRKGSSKHGGEWSANLNASIFQAVSVSFTNYDNLEITCCSDSIFEEYLDLINGDTEWINSVSTSTGDTSKIRYVFETWNQRLKCVVSASHAPVRDKQRVFSTQLKQELFRQDPNCKICQQEIKLLNDAAVDHLEHYWRGGQTIPENARLVHRQCNLERPHRES